MAYREHYCTPTGSNLNSGSTQDDAASITVTNGNWDSSTGVYIAPSGTPFASGIAANDWVSMYADGATIAQCILRVVSVDSSTQLTLSTTDRFGNLLSTSATARSLKLGGAWANITDLANTNGAFNTAQTVTAATRVTSA